MPRTTRTAHALLLELHNMLVMHAMLVVFVLSVSALLKYAESCSVRPVYSDLCDREVSPCLGVGSVRLRCSVDEEASAEVRFQWYNASTNNLATGDTAHLLKPSEDLQGREVSITSEGYWWCRATTDSADTQICASVVPAVHFYRCSCSPDGFEILRFCPSSDRTCDIILAPRRCAANEESIFCLTATEVLLPVPQSTALPGPTATVKQSVPITALPLILQSTHVTETKMFLMHSRQTLESPYQTPNRHGVTTTPAKPSGTTVIDRTDKTPGDNSETEFLYIVGPIVVIMVVSIIVLLVIIGCVRHRRKKYRFQERRQTNSRRDAACNGCTKDEHIYDTVVLVKGPLSSPYCTTPTRAPCVAAEYEVPVCKKEASEPISCQINESYSVNPVHLEVYGNGQVPVNTSE